MTRSLVPRPTPSQREGRQAARTRHPATAPRPSARRATSSTSPPPRRLPARPAPGARTGRPGAPRPTTGGARPDGTGYILLAIVGVLCAVGLVMVLSASSVGALRAYGTAWRFFIRQVLWVLIGGGVMAGTAKVDYHRWRRPAVPLLALSLALLVIVLVPGVGITVAGSTRWLGYGAFQMQPSELAKLAVVLFSADLFARRADSALPTVRPVLIVFGVVALLVMLQPDMGTMLVTLFATAAVLHVGGTSARRMVGLTSGAVVAALALGVVEPYRRARLTSFLHPFKDAGNTGYQVAQSLIGLGSGGVIGVGVGASRAKWGFLPNAHTDFIFAIIGEELGLIGSLLVVALFAAFAVCGLRIARRAPDRYGTLVAAAITAWVVGQALLNIGAVIGLLPVTGVPLPFVSFGGSSLVILLGAVGLLLNIARQGRSPRPADAR